MQVQVKLIRIIISEIHEKQVVILKEVDGERQFPIVIGIFEASSIDRRVKKESVVPRPLTHDLVVDAIDQMGGTLKSIQIHDLQETTYFAKIVIRQGDKEVELDSRPSDAIAIAMTVDPPLPIYVDQQVLETASQME